MDGYGKVAIARASLLGCVMIGILGGPATAETLIEQSAEYRLQLDFRVPDAALALKLLICSVPSFPSISAAILVKFTPRT